MLAMSPLTSEEVAQAEELRAYVFSTNDERGVGRGVDQRRVDALSEEQRQLLVSYFHANLDRWRKQSRSERDLRSSGTERYLARLGDAWGLEAVAENFRNRPRQEWSYDFKFVRNAKLIAMIGDLLFKNEEQEWSDDLGFPATQWTTAQGIIATIKYAPQFLPDISQWALQLEDAWSKPGGDVINILREWYRAKEDKLRAGQFFDIRPGRTPMPRPSAEALPSANSGESPSVRDDSPQTVAVAVHQTAPATSPTWTLWTAAGVCLVLAGASLWYRKSRRGG
jgi:hypothetical protein